MLTHEKALQSVSSLLENFQTAIVNSQASLESDRAANAKEFDSRLQGLVDAMSKANADAITGDRSKYFLMLSKKLQGQWVKALGDIDKHSKQSRSSQTAKRDLSAEDGSAKAGNRKRYCIGQWEYRDLI